MLRLLVWPVTVCTCLAFAWASLGQAPTLPDNANISRESFGTIAWRTMSTGDVRGEERFHITAHPDGSRSVMAVSRYGPRDIQRHSLYRIDAALRPIDASIQYWIEGDWRASGTITTTKAQVSVQSRSPQGTAGHIVDVSGPFAVLPHQLAPDAWRALLYDRAKGGVQNLAVYDPAPLAEGPDGLLGQMTAQPTEYLGTERITVPAGTFESDHFRIGNSIDLFVTGPDAILVTWRFSAIDREHVLTSLTRR